MGAFKQLAIVKLERKKVLIIINKIKKGWGWCTITWK